MATALAKGVLRAGVVPVSGMIASDASADARAAFSKETGVKTTGFNPDVVAFAEVLILAVKPNQAMAVLSGIRQNFSERHLLISIAAGITLARLEEALGAGSRIVRVMPNTPALIGASASAYSLNKSATSEDSQLAEKLFSSVGVAVQVPESQLDAVTGLSGSGPAYVFQVIEALSDGGVAAGLPREIATRLAAQTVLGSARMVLETGRQPAQLKDDVASPGGTTIEGLHELERGGLRGVLMNAVRSAADKSRKLGQS
jgi:pyrroline-5-carboxylate reductase